MITRAAELLITDLVGHRVQVANHRRAVVQTLIYQFRKYLFRVAALRTNCDEQRFLPRTEARRQHVVKFAVERSEEHTSELPSLMRISYAVFCLKNSTSHH